MAEQELSEATGATSNQSFINADAEAIGRTFAIATTPEAAEYFHERFLATIEQVKGGMAQYKEVLDEIHNFAEIIRLQSLGDTSRLWEGNIETAVTTKYRAYQESRANLAVKALAIALPDDQVISFDFAINKEAQLLQGFSIEGKALIPEQAEDMNLVFSDWLTMNQMVCENGVIYQADETGTILKTPAGDRLIVDSEDYVNRFLDGFELFCADKSKQTTGKELRVHVTQREYPKPTPGTTEKPSN